MPGLRTLAKRPVNLTLSPDLVRRARAITANLSETVELLLSSHVTAEEARRHPQVQGAAWTPADEAGRSIRPGFSEVQAPLKPASARTQAGYDWMRMRRDARPGTDITSVQLLDLLHEPG
jgi:post-segregation antitoxin (ccd killing protein)